MSVDLLLENIEKTQGSLRILKIQKRIATDINTLVSGKNQTRERFYTINSVNLAFRLRKNSICMGDKSSEVNKWRSRQGTYSDSGKK